MNCKGEDCTKFVVIDGSNVATIKTTGSSHVHGHGREFDATRIATVIAYFQQRQIPCIAFVPQYALYIKPREGKDNAVMETDSWDCLSKLQRSGEVVLTPPQSHDDEFILSYAMRHNAFILSNDLFRDHNGKIYDDKKFSNKWRLRHCISFMFAGADFVPDPRKTEHLMRALPRVTLDPPSPKRFQQLDTSSKVINADVPWNKILGTPSISQEAMNFRHHSDSAEMSLVTNDEGLNQSQTIRIIDLSDGYYRTYPSELIASMHDHEADHVKWIQEQTDTQIFVPKTSSGKSINISVYGTAEGAQQAFTLFEDFLARNRQTSRSSPMELG